MNNTLRAAATAPRNEIRTGILLMAFLCAMLSACSGGGGGGAAAPASATPPAPPAGGDQFGSGPDPVPDPTGNPTSYSLIDAAQTAGTITEGEALLYKLYVEFADPALPAQYRGDDTGLIEGDAHEQVVAYIDRTGLANVPAATLDALWPFFVPAYYEGSWWHKQNPTAKSAASGAAFVAKAANPNCRAWESLCPALSDWKNVAGTHVVVWYLTANETVDGPRANILLQEFENTIWPSLTALMGRTPISDLGTGLVSETDGRLDVLLVDMPGNKEGITAKSTLTGCKAVPAHIYLNRGLAYNGMIAQAAHEFMHAIQFSYSVASGCVTDYYTTLEATAVWATNYVYPANDWEHKYAKHYLTGSNTTRAYDDKAAPPLFRYGAYLLPLFLESRFGAAIVKEIWEKTLVFSTELIAIDSALVGRSSSFSKEWPKFVAANWNRDTIAAGNYLKADRLTDLPDMESDDTFTLPAGGVGSGVHAVSLPHASSAYYRVAFGDAVSRSVMIVNGLTFKADSQDLTGAGNTMVFTGLDVIERSGASMQVYLKVNGAWQSAAHNLSNVMAATVCRDDPAGKIEEIVFMYANAEISPTLPNYTALVPRAKPPGILATNIGCRDWTGSLSMTRPLNTGQETLTVSNIVLKNLLPTAAPLPGLEPATYPLPVGTTNQISLGYGYVYANASGNAVWTYNETTSRCTNTGSKSFSIANPTQARHTFSNWTPLGTAAHGVFLLGVLDVLTTPQLSYVSVCTSPSSTTTVNTTAFDMDVQALIFDPAVRISTGTGLSVSGTGAQTGDPTKATGTWSFTGSTQ